MRTYLLAWNPKRWQWQDLAEMSDAVKAGATQSRRWSCGTSKRPQEGDRAFLIRLGEDPRGIFASGTILEGSYEDFHWDDEQAAAGKTSRFVKVQFDTLLNPETDPILPRYLLDAPSFSGMHWDTQMSGVHIPEKVAEELEQVWTGFANPKTLSLPEEVEAESLYEGATQRISVNAYERNPEARSKCIGHYGTSCFVCGFDLAERYGEVGKGLIHVHHLRPLSEVREKYRVDPIQDLRPVCPNCHAIIHQKRPAYTVGLASVPWTVSD